MFQVFREPVTVIWLGRFLGGYEWGCLGWF